MLSLPSKLQGSGSSRVLTPQGFQGKTCSEWGVTVFLCATTPFFYGSPIQVLTTADPVRSAKSELGRLYYIRMQMGDWMLDAPPPHSTFFSHVHAKLSP